MQGVAQDTGRHTAERRACSIFPTLKTHKHTTEPQYRCWQSFRVGKHLYARDERMTSTTHTHTACQAKHAHTRQLSPATLTHLLLTTYVCGRQLPSQHNSPFDGGDIISPPVLDRIRSRGASFPPGRHTVARLYSRTQHTQSLVTGGITPAVGNFHRHGAGGRASHHARCSFQLRRQGAVCNTWSLDYANKNVPVEVDSMNSVRDNLPICCQSLTKPVHASVFSSHFFKTKRAFESQLTFIS